MIANCAIISARVLYKPRTILAAHLQYYLAFKFMADSQSNCLDPPQSKRTRRQCHFDSKWLQEFPGIGRSSNRSGRRRERGFSVLRRIHTDQRPSLKQSTIISLMYIKFNSEECCHDTILDENLLTTCKKATVAQNKQL